MARRFTTTEKWKKSFMRNLDGKFKLLWLYIMDDCDHAGIWHVDLEVAELRLGFSFDIKEVKQAFGAELKEVAPLVYYFPEFIIEQYGGLGCLNSSNKVHKSVLKILSNYKIDGLIEKEEIKPLPSPFQGAKDKDKDKDKDKATKGGVGEKLNEFGGISPEEMETALQGASWREWLMMWLHNHKGVMISTKDLEEKVQEFLFLAKGSPEEYSHANAKSCQNHLRNWIKFNVDTSKKKESNDFFEGMSPNAIKSMKALGIDEKGFKKNKA